MKDKHNVRQLVEYFVEQFHHRSLDQHRMFKMYSLLFGVVEGVLAGENRGQSAGDGAKLCVLFGRIDDKMDDRGSPKKHLFDS